MGVTVEVAVRVTLSTGVVEVAVGVAVGVAVSVWLPSGAVAVVRGVCDPDSQPEVEYGRSAAAGTCQASRARPIGTRAKARVTARMKDRPRRDRRLAGSRRDCWGVCPLVLSEGGGRL